MNNVGLYIHVPFCRSKCAYCDFYSLAANEETKRAYIGALCRQIGALAPSCAGSTVDTVYFGGGTPSILAPEALTAVLDRVAALYSVAENAEITLEANPATVGGEGLFSLREAGFNRISFGVQSANDATLRKLGRLHTFAEAERSVTLAFDRGFENVSADLMYALPDESPGDLYRSIQKTAALPIRHLSLYGLKIEENTPFGRAADLRLPDEDVQADIYLHGVEMLEERGFRQYEISNFARRGYESRHNLKYWTRAPYLGFGPGAHSFFEGARFCFPRDLAGYIKQEDFSLSPDVYADFRKIEGREALEEEVLLGLRTAYGSPLDLLYRLAENRALLESRMKTVLSQGLAKVVCGRLFLTPRGMLLSNAIISDLLSA